MNLKDASLRLKYAATVNNIKMQWCRQLVFICIALFINNGMTNFKSNVSVYVALVTNYKPKSPSTPPAVIISPWPQ